MASSLYNYMGQELTWTPTAAFKARYELVAPDGAVLATLDMGNWSMKATVTSEDQTFFIRKETWTGMKVGIYANEQEAPLATYQRKWTGTGGQLFFPNGRAFKWGQLNFWGTQKAWSDPAGNATYVQVSANGFGRKSHILIQPQASDIPLLPLLVILGLYNIIIERRDQAAAAAASS